jgi:DNA primase
MRDSVIDEIKSRLDIVQVVGEYVRLQKAGINYRARCPFHEEKTPSFFVSPSRQTWHCFGSCSEGGDVFKFIMKIEGIEFGDALRMLAQKAGVELKKEDPRIRSERERLYEICELATKFYEKQMESKKGLECWKYLQDRGFNKESVVKWRIGYSPEGGLTDWLVGQGYKRDEVNKVGLSVNGRDRFRSRIIFPIFNLGSQVVGFGGRVSPGSKDDAKYINSPATILYDKSRILYGLDKAKLEIRKKDYCLLVEGYTDVILASQAGYDNIVSTSGTALTSDQLDILKRYTDNLYTAFDMDLAGNSATKRGINLARSKGFNIRVVTMVSGLDPADMIKEKPEEWKQGIEKACSVMDFYLHTALQQNDIETVEGKKKIADTVLPEIKIIENSIEKDSWINKLANLLEVSSEAVRQEIDKQKVESSNLIEEKQKISIGRRQLLEKTLIISALKKPEVLQEIKDMSCLSSETVSLLEQIKKGEKLETEEFNALAMQAEVTEDFDAKQEFHSCYNELKKLQIKEQLTKCHLSIKKMEGSQDEEKSQKALQEFQNYCESLQDCEKGEDLS